MLNAKTTMLTTTTMYVRQRIRGYVITECTPKNRPAPPMRTYMLYVFKGFISCKKKKKKKKV